MTGDIGRRVRPPRYHLLTRDRWYWQEIAVQEGHHSGYSDWAS